VTILDAPLRAVSKTLLDTFGTAGTITRVTVDTDYKPKRGTQSETLTTTSVNGVLENYRAIDPSVFAESARPVRTTDQKYTVPATDLSFTPDVDDRVTIGSDNYRIVNVRQVMSGDQAALVVLQLRRDE
jgi:hypothetical protein